MPTGWGALWRRSGGRRTCGVLALCGASFLAYAEDPVPRPTDPLAVQIEPEADVAAELAGTLSLDALEAIALENHPSLGQAGARVAMARGDHLQVGLYPNPTVGYVGTQVPDRGTPGQQGGYLGQVIVTKGKLQLNRAIVSQEIQGAIWRQEQQVWTVRNAVRQRYWEYLGADRSVEVCQRLRATANAAVQATQDLLKAGEGTRPDVLQAEVEAEQAGLLLFAAQRQREAVWRRMVAILGIGDVEQTRVAGNFEADPPDIDFDGTYALLLAESPELGAAQAAVNRASWAIQRARVEPYPNIDVQSSVQRDNGAQETISNLQVTVPVPIYNRNQGAIAAAAADMRRAQGEVQRLQLSLKDRLAVAYRRYALAKQQVERYETQILPKAQTSLDLITTGYKRGETPYLQVLVVQRTYFQTSLAAIEARTELWRSVVALEGLLLTTDASEDAIPAPAEVK